MPPDDRRYVDGDALRAEERGVVRVELPSSVRGSGPLSSSLVRGVREGERGERADDFGERGEVRSVMRHRKEAEIIAWTFWLKVLTRTSMFSTF